MSTTLTLVPNHVPRTGPATLLITRGYPGSGKTTLARELCGQPGAGLVRVNRDDYRHMLFGAHSGLTHDQEQEVTVAQHGAIRALLSHGVDVIVDDTNLRLKHARAFADLAADLGCGFAVVEVETPVEECIAHDAARKAAGGRGVGEKVIRDFASRYPMPWPKVRASADARPKVLPYVPNEDLPEAWILDIDGTLAINDGHRGWYGPEAEAKVGDDKPNQRILDVAWALRFAGAKLIVMSGRTEGCRTETEGWLEEHLGPYEALHMRAVGDQREDSIVKAELFDTHVRDHYNVHGVLDDRDSVVRMWRDDLGLTTLQVGWGNF